MHELLLASHDGSAQNDRPAPPCGGAGGPLVLCRPTLEFCGRPADSQLGISTDGSPQTMTRAEPFYEGLLS